MLFFRHSLIISSVEKEDFGVYSCHANSEKGSASETIEISGRKFSFSLFWHLFTHKRNFNTTTKVSVLPHIKLFKLQSSFLY